MRRFILRITVMGLSAVLPLLAQPQSQPQPQPQSQPQPQPQQSLGDVARQLREQKEKDAKKAAKVITNDNLLAPAPGETLTIMPSNEEKPATETPSKATTSSTPETGKETGKEASKEKPASSDPKTRTQDEWRAKFKSAREDLAKAKEMQQLSEDELNLLQIQEARELDPVVKADLDTKITDKQSEVDLNKTTTDLAQKTLDDLEKEFKDSGAPDDWSKTD